MKKEWMPKERAKPRSRKVQEQTEAPSADTTISHTDLASLHHHIGNQAVQRLLAQRSGQEPTELDGETADRINHARGGGQPLEASIQAQMGEAMGTDLGSVRVHTSPESNALSQQLGAKAFTTGQDVFFRQDAYNPHSTEGQELIAHELTHVVQQRSGAGGAGPMTVNAPGDAFEQEADTVAKTIAGGEGGAAVQRQEEEEEEELVQAQPEEEEEEELVQAQEEDEEELAQMQEEEEEEELVQAQEEEEEDLLK